MITNIKLTNFRAFREKIDVRIRPITILIGRNSAGKSTLVKFLLMLQQTLESSEGGFFTTEGRHVSLGIFQDLKNSTSRSNSLQFSLDVETNDMPDPAIQSVREDLQHLKPIKSDRKSGNDRVKLEVGLKTFSTISTLDPLKEEATIKVPNAISKDEAIARYTISGTIPYGKSTKGKHSVSCVIKNKTILDKQESNIRRARFLNFSLPNSPVEILKSAFDNLYLDGLSRELIAMRHLSAVREESQRSVILGSPPSDDVGHRGEYAMPHLQRLLDQGDERAEFILKHIESILDIEEIRFKPLVKGFIPEFRAKNKLTGADAYLADFGFGVSQCIPIFVQGALLNRGQLLIVEQPEAQIHPTAQLEIGSFFADLWNNRKVPSLIETHSENIILRLRLLISKGQLKSEDVSLAYFYTENKVVKVKNLDINPDGSFERGLPMEFFGRDLIEALQIGV